MSLETINMYFTRKGTSKREASDSVRVSLPTQDDMAGKYKQGSNPDPS